MVRVYEVEDLFVIDFHEGAGDVALFRCVFCLGEDIFYDSGQQSSVF